MITIQRHGEMDGRTDIQPETILSDNCLLICLRQSCGVALSWSLRIGPNLIIIIIKQEHDYSDVRQQ